MKKLGQVHLVGAGPGDPELLTLKAARLIARADAIVYDRLVSAEILALAPPLARMIPVGKAPGLHPVPQEQINELLVALAFEGLKVVRLKGGDPFMFGRGAEEIEALKAAGVPHDVAPGVTAAQGCAASTGVPLTHRGLATGVRYVTGHRCADQPLDLDWDGLADPETTLVVYMGAANIGEIAAQLIARGLPCETPVLAVGAATTLAETRVVTRLGSVAADIARSAPAGPVLFIIGRVVSLYEERGAEVLARLAAGAEPAAFHA